MSSGKWEYSRGVGSWSIGILLAFTLSLLVSAQGGMEGIQEIVITPGGNGATVKVTSGEIQHFDVIGFLANGSAQFVPATLSIVGGESETGSFDNETNNFTAWKIGTVTLMATYNNGSEELTDITYIEVIAGDAVRIEVSLESSTLPPDGNSTTIVMASVFDANSNPIENHTISFSIGEGDGNITTLNSLTNGSGTATALYTAGTTPGIVSITAEDITVGGLLGQVNLTLSSEEAFILNLNEGWNLISLPVIV